jgi:hypothetical protein
MTTWTDEMVITGPEVVGLVVYDFMGYPSTFYPDDHGVINLPIGRWKIRDQRTSSRINIEGATDVEIRNMVFTDGGGIDGPGYSMGKS